MDGLLRGMGVDGVCLHAIDATSRRQHALRLVRASRAALEIDSKPFFARADGVFQLYVELPYHHYLEIDSLTFHGTVGTPSARAWADVV